MKLSDLQGYKVVGQVPAPQQPQAPQPDLLQKASDIATSVFPGTKQIGESLGTAAFNVGQLAQGKTDLAPVDTGKTIGGYVQAGASVAGLETGGASLTQRILSNLGIGAAIGGGAALAKGGNASDVVKGAAATGALGATLPLAGQGLKTIGNQITQLPARLVESALGRSKAEVLNDIAKDRVDNFAQYVIQNKPIGSAQKLLGESMDNINAFNTKVNTAISSAVRQDGTQVTVGTNNLLDQVTSLPEAQGALLQRPDVKAIVEKLAPQTKQLLSKPSLTLVEANKLRTLVDHTLGDRGFLTNQLSSDKAVLKGFANTLRETVKSKAPEGTRKLFSDYANEIRFRDGLLDRVAKKAGNQVLSFGDFIGGGLGGVFGGGVPGAIAGVATRRAIESVPFKIGSAKVVDALTKAGPILDQLAPAQQTAIMNLFTDLFSEGNSANTPSPQK